MNNDCECIDKKELLELKRRAALYEEQKPKQWEPPEGMYIIQRNGKVSTIPYNGNYLHDKSLRRIPGRWIERRNGGAMSKKVIHIFSELKGHFDIQYTNDVIEGCDSIEEHRPQGEGDKWFYDVKKGDRTFRLFDVKVVTFKN